MSNTPMHGSDVQVTPEWWKASDGRFYPPELHPDYVKPAAPAPAPAAEPPSLVDQAQAAADQASAAAAAGVGAVGSTGASDSAAAGRSTLDDAVSPAGGQAAAVESPSSAVSAAAAEAVADVMPDLATPSFDPKSTIPQDLPAAGLAQTIIHSGAPLASPGAPPPIPPSTPPSMPGAPPSMPPGAPPSSPGAPPSMPPGAPPSMPPSPGAPPSMPPASMPPASMPPGMPPAPGGPPSAPPGMPPAPGPRVSPQPGAVEQGPGGITYTSPAAATMPPPLSQPPTSFGAPTAPTAASKVASSTSGLLALIAGAASIAGSLLLWGSGDVVGVNGAEKGIIEVAGFDSSGLFAAVGGGVLILCAILFFMGIPNQTYWAGAAFITGAVIVGAVVFSAIDIQDLSDRLAVQFQSEGRVVDGDTVNVKPAIGLFISGVGGVLGVLAAPFVNRN